MIILIDIGGTNTRIALSRDKMTLAKKISFKTEQDFEMEIAEIKKNVTALSGNQKIECIVAAVPGPLSEGTIVSSVNLKNWQGKNVQEAIIKATGVQTTVLNDAELAALGEAVFGAGKEHEVVGFITVSTGIGGARIVNKNFDIISSSFEPGKQIVDFSLKRNLEEIVAGAAVQRERGLAPKQITDKAFWREKAKILAIGVWNALIFWSPQVFILGGPMILKVPGINIEDVKKELEKINNNRIVLPPIVHSMLADDAGLHGALAYARMLQNKQS